MIFCLSCFILKQLDESRTKLETHLCHAHPKTLFQAKSIVVLVDAEKYREGDRMGEGEISNVLQIAADE